MKDPAWLARSWERIRSQARIDKVYIKSYEEADQELAYGQAHG